VPARALADPARAPRSRPAGGALGARGYRRCGIARLFVAHCTLGVLARVRLRVRARARAKARARVRALGLGLGLGPGPGPGPGLRAKHHLGGGSALPRISYSRRIAPLRSLVSSALLLVSASPSAVAADHAVAPPCGRVRARVRITVVSAARGLFIAREIGQPSQPGQDRSLGRRVRVHRGLSPQPSCSGCPLPSRTTRLIAVDG
jgi:hypothetical protein